MEFKSAKAKKYLVFVELLSGFPRDSEDISYDESLVDNHLFLINSSDLLICGMVPSSSIYKPQSFPLMFSMRSEDASIIRLNTTSLLMIHYIDEGWILSYDDA